MASAEILAPRELIGSDDLADYFLVIEIREDGYTGSYVVREPKVVAAALTPDSDENKFPLPTDHNSLKSDSELTFDSLFVASADSGIAELHTEISDLVVPPATSALTAPFFPTSKKAQFPFMPIAGSRVKGFDSEINWFSTPTEVCQRPIPKPPDTLSLSLVRGTVIIPQPEIKPEDHAHEMFELMLETFNGSLMRNSVSQYQLDFDDCAYEDPFAETKTSSDFWDFYSKPQNPLSALNFSILNKCVRELQDDISDVRAELQFFSMGASPLSPPVARAIVISQLQDLQNQVYSENFIGRIKQNRVVFLSRCGNRSMGFYIHSAELNNLDVSVDVHWAYSLPYMKLGVYEYLRMFVWKPPWREMGDMFTGYLDFFNYLMVWDSLPLNFEELAVAKVSVGYPTSCAVMSNVKFPISTIADFFMELGNTSPFSKWNWQLQKCLGSGTLVWQAHLHSSNFLGVIGKTLMQQYALRMDFYVFSINRWEVVLDVIWLQFSRGVSHVFDPLSMTSSPYYLDINSKHTENTSKAGYQILESWKIYKIVFPAHDTHYEFLVIFVTHLLVPMPTDTPPPRRIINAFPMHQPLVIYVFIHIFVTGSVKRRTRPFEDFICQSIVDKGWISYYQTKAIDEYLVQQSMDLFVAIQISVHDPHISEGFVNWPDCPPDKFEWRFLVGYCNVYCAFHLEDKVNFQGVESDTPPTLEMEMGRSSYYEAYVEERPNISNSSFFLLY